MALGNPYGGMMRCIMNADKTIAYFLDPNDSNYKMDGTAVDWALVESSAQNVMVQIPKFYYCKKWDVTNQCFYFAVSSTIKDTAQISAGEWVVHPAFFKDQTKASDSTVAIAVEVPYRYIGAFHGWVDTSGRMRSLPNKVQPTANIISVHRASAKAMGLGYCQMDYYLLYAIQMLYITEFGDPNSQKILGPGFLTTLINTSGTTLLNGNNTKPATASLITHISYRGIEDIWGPVSVILEGCLVYYFDFIIANANYTSISSYITSSTISKTSGYVRNIVTDNNSGFLPLNTSTIADTGLSDIAPQYNGLKRYDPVCIYGINSGSTYTGIFGLKTILATATGSSRLAL